MVIAIKSLALIYTLECIKSHKSHQTVDDSSGYKTRKEYASISYYHTFSSSVFCGEKKGFWPKTNNRICALFMTFWPLRRVTVFCFVLFFFRSSDVVLFLRYFDHFVGVVNQLCRFTLWSWWHSSVQNHANASSSETATCHVPYAGHEGTYTHQLTNHFQILFTRNLSVSLLKKPLPPTPSVFAIFITISIEICIVMS